MKVNVISLRDSPRRDLVESRLRSVGLDWNFFDAVDLRRASSNEIESVFDVGTFLSLYRRRPASGEVGCTLSHINLCAQLAAGYDDFSVVVEDDVIPLVGASELERVINVARVKHIDILLLGYSKTDDRGEMLMRRVNPVCDVFPIPDGRYSIGKRYKECTVGTVAYGISRRAAERLSAIDRPFHLADDWKYIESLGLKIFHLNPLGFREDYQGLASEIESDRAMLDKGLGRRKALLKAAYLARLARGTIYRALLEIRCFHLKAK